MAPAVTDFQSFRCRSAEVRPDYRQWVRCRGARCRRIPSRTSFPVRIPHFAGARRSPGSSRSSYRSDEAFSKTRSPHHQPPLPSCLPSSRAQAEQFPGSPVPQVWSSPVVARVQSVLVPIRCVCMLFLRFAVAELSLASKPAEQFPGARIPHVWLVPAVTDFQSVLVPIRRVLTHPRPHHRRCRASRRRGAQPEQLPGLRIPHL